MTTKVKLALVVGAVLVGAVVWRKRAHAMPAPTPGSGIGICVEGEDGTEVCGGDVPVDGHNWWDPRTWTTPVIRTGAFDFFSDPPR